MRIRTISTAQIRRMGDQEGLILQGCGGDPQEWLDGINEILAKEAMYQKIVPANVRAFVDMKVESQKPKKKERGASASAVGDGL